MWHKSENTVRPLPIDTESSKIYNIITKNVEEVVYEDEEGQEQTKFVYTALVRNESDVQDIAEALDILTTIVLEG